MIDDVRLRPRVFFCCKKGCFSAIFSFLCVNVVHTRRENKSISDGSKTHEEILRTSKRRKHDFVWFVVVVQ